jgi:hypothetical protein
LKGSSLKNNLCEIGALKGTKMAAYHQMGHDSENLISNCNLSLYKGAVLSPVNINEETMRVNIAGHSSDSFEMIFDPQLYFPSTDRGCLPDWSYFPSDVDTAEQTSIRWWRSIINRLSNTISRLQPQAVCSPAVVPRVYSNDYYTLNQQVSSLLQDRLARHNIEVLQTLIVSLSELCEEGRSAEIASIATSSSVNRIYLVLIADVAPRRELRDTNCIKGAMRLIRFLASAGVRILVGFSSSDQLLWKYSGAHDCATGKFFNLRRFTPSRFIEPSEGRGQIPYWFEESLMAYIRDSDLERIKERGFLSVASRSNPFCVQILEQMSASPERPWLGLSWRQYLYWFADFENRFSRGEIEANSLLQEAENRWGQLEEYRILFEERQNDGAWLRQWRRSLIEAFA